MTPLAKHSLHRSEQELERQVSSMLTPAEMAQLTGDLEAARPAREEDAPSVPCVLAMIPSVFVGMALVYLVIFFVGAVG